MPILSLPRFLLSLVSLAILAGALYLLWSWGHGYDFRAPDGTWRHVERAAPWRLWTGTGLLAWSFLGRFVVLALMPDREDPGLSRGQAQTLAAPDGARIALETAGRPDGPVIVLTHGWGMDRRSWAWIRPELEGRFRLALWDLPGMGQSRLAHGKLSLERMAQALGTVIDSVAERPVVLVGHSIGGMVIQTLLRVRPDLVAGKLAGLVLVHTTYANPLRTMWLAPVWRALQKPVLEPASWLTMALSPVVWLSNWQSWLSGSAQLAMRLTGFGRYASRRQVDGAALMACQNSPGVQAKGNLAMFHWEGEEALRRLDIPVLVISGDRDLVTLPGAGEVIASRIHGARMGMLEGAGHMGVMEASQTIAGEIARFAEEAFLAPRAMTASDVSERRQGGDSVHPPPLH